MSEAGMQEGLRYIADCLEKAEIYSPSTDEFIRGDAINPLLIDFARKLAAGKLAHWDEWIARKNAVATGDLKPDAVRTHP